MDDFVRRSRSVFIAARRYFLLIEIEQRQTAASAPHSRILGRSGCGIRNSDAAASHSSTHMRTPHNRNVLSVLSCTCLSPLLLFSSFSLLYPSFFSLFLSRVLSFAPSGYTSILNNAQHWFYSESKNPSHVRSPLR